MTADEFSNVGEIAVLADCHIHPGGGVDWPAAALEALAGADLIVTLGDMGEARGLEALAAVAPVIGVKGADDGDDPRTAPAARVLEAVGVRIGCVFDPVAAGLAVGSAPLVPVEAFAAAEARLFGRPVTVVLYASTHAPAIDDLEGRLWVNPGSATLPAGQERGAGGTLARLTIEAGVAKARIASL